MTVNGATTASVSVGWRSATDNVAVAGYEVWLQNRMVGRLSARKRSHTFSGLACGSTYLTGVIAYDASGNRSNGTTLTTATSACAATTPPPTGDTTPPTAPATLTTSSSTPTAITLAWPAATDNVGVTEYAVYVGSTRVGSTGTTSYVVSGLTCGTSYQVSVDAADAAGNRSAKTSASVATASCGDTAPPSTPTGLQLMVANETSVTVAWSPSSDNVGVTGYGVYLSNLLVNSPTSPSVTLTGLTCGTPYQVEVDAADAAGNRSTKASLWVNTRACPDTTPPSAPSGLTIGNRTQTSLVAAVDGLERQRRRHRLRAAPQRRRHRERDDDLRHVLRAQLRDLLHARRRPPTTLRGTARRRPRRRPRPLPAPPVTHRLRRRRPGSRRRATRRRRSRSDGTRRPTTSASPATGSTAAASASGRPPSTSYTVSGLSCGTSYALGVDAYDAANNKSAAAPLNASTAACASPPPPPPPPPPPSGSAANLWIDTNGGSCTRATTAGGHADAQACSSFAAAYSAAQSGDTVGVAAGTYSEQFFAGGYQASQGCGSKTLTFKGQPGNTIRALHIGSPNLTFDGLNIDAGGQKTSGAAFENGGDPFVFKNGSIGNVVDEKGALVTELRDPLRQRPVPRRVLATDGVHNECVWAGVADGMVIRNSTFTNCRTFDIFTTYPGWWSPLPPAYGGIVLENNTFNSPVPNGHPSLYVADTGPNGDRVMRNWTIRNNAFVTAPVTAPQQGGTFCGNSGSAPSGWQTSC